MTWISDSNIAELFLSIFDKDLTTRHLPAAKASC